MFGILEAVSVPHSGVYASCEDLMRDLNSRAEKEGYKIVKARSDRSRPGGPIIRADLVCERGGRPYRCQATKHKTSTKKTNCPWKAKAVDRKLLGGWVLTIICDHHNHEPGTPEPPTPSEGSEAGEEEEAVRTEGPRPDDETAVALQVAGVSDSVLRLSGDTFHRFKGEYRKMSQPERLGILAQMQLRIAAIYAVQNEDMQRQKRQDAQDKRHREIEENKRRLEAGGLHSAKRLRGVPPGLAANVTPSETPAQRQYSRIAPAPAPAPATQEPNFQPVPAASAEPTPQMSFQAYPGPPKRGRAGRQSRTATQQQPAQQPVQQQGQQPSQKQPQQQSQLPPGPMTAPTNTAATAALEAAEAAKS